MTFYNVELYLCIKFKKKNYFVYSAEFRNSHKNAFFKYFCFLRFLPFFFTFYVISKKFLNKNRIYKANIYLKSVIHIKLLTVLTSHKEFFHSNL